MEEQEHKTFLRSAKALSIVPLLLLSLAGVYYVMKHRSDETSGKVPQDFSFGRPAAPAPGTPAAGAPSAAAPARPLPAPAEAGASKNISALDIQGSSEFKGRVTTALKLIWESDRESFLFIKRYIFVIRNEDRTGFYFDPVSGLPVAAVSGAHAFRSLTWCAGIIAHQAFHSYAAFGMKRKKAGGAPPPVGSPEKAALRPMPSIDGDYTGLDKIQDLEAKASRFQAGILEKVEAPRSELNEVLKRKPLDYRTGHDGQYDILVKP